MSKKEFYKTYELKLTLSEINNKNRPRAPDSYKSKQENENTSKSKTKKRSNIETYFWLIGLVATLAVCTITMAGKENIKRVITDIDDCSPNPCLNNGVCVDKVDDFSCKCPQWFSGKRCRIDNQPCKNHQCRNGGTCINNPDGSYKCECPTQIGGKFCERPHRLF